jgi:hypothetical protein
MQSLNRAQPAQTAVRPVNVPVALSIALVVSVLLWLIPGASLILIPIHPYLTFVHEGWHALIAVLTGGQVSRVQIFGVFGTGGGVTNITGGATLLVASAGYVGSAITGALFLWLLPHPMLLRVVLAVQFAWLVALAFLWDHDPSAWIYLIAFGAVLYLLAWKLPHGWFAIATGFLSLQLALAVVGDLRTLLVINLGGTMHNDAQVAAQVTHLPPLLWALVWSAIAAVLLFFALRSALGFGRRRSQGAYQAAVRTRA